MSQDQFRKEFVQFALEADVLRFGSFVTKAGRTSPYFFNAGLFNTGGLMAKLSDFYARTLLASGHEFDMLFGPAYKGIPLATGVAMALAHHGKNVPFAYNRKEAKDHGEGGTLVGAPLQGRVVIIDDVISAGTSVRESVDLIKNAGATPSAVLIALDRMEKVGADDALSANSAVQEVSQQYGIPVFNIASLEDILRVVAADDSRFSSYEAAIVNYRTTYGVNR